MSIQVYKKKMIYDDPSEWDVEWASDWEHLVDIANQVEILKYKFRNFEVPYLLEIAQKQIILNLEKYLGLLSHSMVDKYSNS